MDGAKEVPFGKKGLGAKSIIGSEFSQNGQQP